jgi:hypothetical protein
MRRSGFIPRKSPLKRGTKRLKRSKLKPFGRRRKRMQKQGKRYGELASFVRRIGQCQARGVLPDSCGPPISGPRLAVCHALSRGAGYGDWVEDVHTGEPRGNLWLGCDWHHWYADNHKAETGEWMKRVARANGDAAIAAGVEPVL